MQIRTHRFNIYLGLIIGLALLCGCQSPDGKRKKAQSVLRIHVEAQNVVPNRTKEITVFRRSPMKLMIEQRPFVNEEQVKDAKVIDTVGGFSLQIEFDRTGRNLLEQYTSGNRTRRLAIFSHFVDPVQEKVEWDRWLGAPRISQAITNGVLIFTPDATREESEQIALGLRNVAKKLGTGKDPF